MNQTYWAVPIPQSSWATDMEVPITHTLGTLARILGGSEQQQQHEQVACKAGTFLSQGSCVPCSSGFVSQGGAFCSICRPGSFANEQQSECIECAAGTGTWAVAPGFSNHKSTRLGMSMELVAQQHGASNAAACIADEQVEQLKQHSEKRFANALYAPPRIQVVGGAMAQVIPNDVSNTPSVSDATLFDQAPVGVPTTHMFTIKNIGLSKLVFNALPTITSDRFSATYSKPLPFFVSPGQPEQLYVTFRGVLPDIINAVLILPSNDPENNTIRFNIRAIPAPLANIPATERRPCNPFCSNIPPASRPPNIRCC
jgi:hypothetical protein